MPQISKLRIVNFQYNEGKRLIADELFDFEQEKKTPSNVLINLANGGGKSVLVQLMLQPVIPKAKVAGRRIESFFTKSTDHCFIAMEWNLENSKMKLMTGIAIASTDARVDQDAERGFQIKYYTFLSSYLNDREAYSITSLPLSRKENGRFVPAAFEDIRSLARKSNGGLLRFASDDSVKWWDKLAEYGVYQNEWRVMEELNASEDGMSKYFSRFRTSDRIIDELILPSIERQQTQSLSKEDNSLETMLISYAMQYSRQKEVIQERSICQGFRTMLEEARTQANALWAENDRLEKSIERLFAYSDALENEISRQQDLLSRLNAEEAELRERLRQIRWEKASAEYYTCKDVFDRAAERFLQAEAAREDAEQQLETAKRKLRLLECANYFGRLGSVESRLSAIRAEIEEREKNTESAHRLSVLKYSARKAISTELERVSSDEVNVTQEKAAAEAELSGMEEECQKMEADIHAAEAEMNRSEGVWERMREENDQTLNALEIDTFRMLDGRYPEQELSAWQTAVASQREEAERAVASVHSELLALEKRREDIPSEIAAEQARISGCGRNLTALAERIREYEAAEKQLQRVCDQYSLDFSLRFTDQHRRHLSERLAECEAQIVGIDREITATEEAIDAAERGTLHIPTMLLEFLEGSGLRYKSVERYLIAQQEKGMITKEQCQELLSAYPHAAYGIIADGQELAELKEEASETWLAALLPVFSNDDLIAMLQGEAVDFRSIAAPDKTYFKDPASYAEGLRNKIRAQNEQKTQYMIRRDAFHEALRILGEFAEYDEVWLERTLADWQRMEEEKKREEAALLGLANELTETKEKISETRARESDLNSEINNIQGKLQSFETLLKKLEEEYARSDQLQEMRTGCRDMRTHKAEKERAKEQWNKQRDALDTRLKELREIRGTLEKGLDSVKDAKKTEIENGSWNVLLEQYRELLNAQSMELNQLQKDMKQQADRKEELEKELQKRACPQAEYAYLVYSEEAERLADSDVKEAEGSFKAADKERFEAAKRHTEAKTRFGTAGKQLDEFGGEALPRSSVGTAFDSRAAALEEQIRQNSGEADDIQRALAALERTQGKTESERKAFLRPAQVEPISLEKDYHAQLEVICGEIEKHRDAVAAGKAVVTKSLNAMRLQYGAESEDVSRAASGMQDLLANTSLQGDRYFTLIEHIGANIHTVSLRLSQIETDLLEFDRTKNDLIFQCLLQGKRMYEGLQELSGRSKVRIQDKRKPMISFDLPDAVDENIARAAVSAEIERGTDALIAKMAEDPSSESGIKRSAAATVGSARLLRRYIGRDTIVLKAYKIDNNPRNSGYRTWEQTQVNNSGAEKFVVYFAVILALLAFSRDHYDGHDGNGSSSVLILDNPFGPISSKHVLEPMFEIARTYNVQMICLSDISKSDISSCFDLVIRAVVKQISLSSKELLTHEGNEQIEHGFYSTEQTKLF